MRNKAGLPKRSVPEAGEYRDAGILEDDDLRSVELPLKNLNSTSDVKPIEVREIIAWTEGKDIVPFGIERLKYLVVQVGDALGLPNPVGLSSCADMIPWGSEAPRSDSVRVMADVPLRCIPTTTNARRCCRSPEGRS